MILFHSGKSSSRTRTPGHVSGLGLPGSLSQLHRIPFDLLLTVRRYPPPCSRTTIHKALHAPGLKTGNCGLSSDTFVLLKSTLPVAGFFVACAQERTLWGETVGKAGDPKVLDDEGLLSRVVGDGECGFRLRYVEGSGFGLKPKEAYMKDENSNKSSLTPVTFASADTGNSFAKQATLQWRKAA